MRDKYGTDQGKFKEKLWDKSRGHLAVSLINHFCVYAFLEMPNVNTESFSSQSAQLTSLPRNREGLLLQRG